MKIGTKILAVASGGVILATAGAVLAVYPISHGTRVAGLRAEMSTILRQAEIVTSDMDELHSAGAFVTIGNVPGNGESYRQTTLYKSLPIVAAWESVRDVARERGFQFFTPSRPDLTARNTANQSAEFDAAFTAFQKGEPEFFREDRNANILLLARPVRLSAGCLKCHGDPAWSPSHDGRDLLGFRMENLRVGDIKGAFVLQAPMTHDALLLASIKQISLTGAIALATVVIGLYFFNRLLIVNPLMRIASDINEEAHRAGEASASTEHAESIEETFASAENAKQTAAAREQLDAQSEALMTIVRRLTALLEGTDI